MWAHVENVHLRVRVRLDFEVHRGCHNAHVTPKGNRVRAAVTDSLFCK